MNKSPKSDTSFFAKGLVVSSAGIILSFGACALGGSKNLPWLAGCGIIVFSASLLAFIGLFVLFLAAVFRRK